MKVISKDTFMHHVNGSTPMAGLFLYISADTSKALLRIYNSIGNDSWDEHIDFISTDNCATFKEHRIAQKREKAPQGGEYEYGEAAALYNPKFDKLTVVTNYGYAPSRETYSVHYAHKSHIKSASPDNIYDAPPLLTDFGFEGGSYMSFCHPFLDSAGRAIFPWMTPQLDNPRKNLKGRGFVVRDGTDNVMADYYDAAAMIGEYDAEGNIEWRIGDPAPFDIDDVSRGLCEPTIVELKDSRFAMICRGSNAFWEGLQWDPKPGYKWLAYSEDGCESWSKMEPLGCADGSLIESGANGSSIFRSIKNGKLYWIGNLCMDGEKAAGNWPRSPLCIAEIQEDPVAIKRETIVDIDKAVGPEQGIVQLSNFRMLQDRQNGDVLLLMNRFGERGGYEDLGWHNTDLYLYRIQID